MKSKKNATPPGTEDASQSGRPVALLTDNAVLAIDIQDALKSVGYSSWTIGKEEFHQFKKAKQPTLAAALVDLGRGEAKVAKTVRWLAERSIPTFVFATDDEVLRGFERFPNVIGHIELPFSVDAILPSIVSAAKT